MVGVAGGGGIEIGKDFPRHIGAVAPRHTHAQHIVQGGASFHPQQLKRFGGIIKHGIVGAIDAGAGVGCEPWLAFGIFHPIGNAGGRVFHFRDAIARGVGDAVGKAHAEQCFRAERKASGERQIAIHSGAEGGGKELVVGDVVGVDARQAPLLRIGIGGEVLIDGVHILHLFGGKIQTIRRGGDDAGLHTHTQQAIEIVNAFYADGGGCA